MTDYKKVGTRTPEKINIDLGAIQNRAKRRF